MLTVFPLSFSPFSSQWAPSFINSKNNSTLIIQQKKENSSLKIYCLKIAYRKSYWKFSISSDILSLPEWVMWWGLKFWIPFPLVRELRGMIQYKLGLSDIWNKWTDIIKNDFHLWSNLGLVDAEGASKTFEKSLHI